MVWNASKRTWMMLFASMKTQFCPHSQSTMVEFFRHLHQYSLKLSPAKARIGATQANFLGHTISPAGVLEDGEKVRAHADAFSDHRQETRNCETCWVDVATARVWHVGKQTCSAAFQCVRVEGDFCSILALIWTQT